MSHEPTSLAIYWLGPARIERNGKPVEVDTRKSIALLAYLALNNERLSRDRLATLFWPDYNQERAYANLRRTLWSINKAVGEGWLVADNITVELPQQEGLWVDVVAFERLLAHCRTHGHRPEEVCAACLEPLVQAAALVRGEFLEGFTLHDSAEFDNWQVFQSEYLRRQFAGVLERLVGGFNAAGAFERALTYVQRWVALDPLHEPAQRQLLLTYAWAGQPSAAAQQYKKYVRILEEELDAPPEEETTQLMEAIRQRRAPAPPLRAEMQQSQTQAPALPPESLPPASFQAVQADDRRQGPAAPATPAVFNNLPLQSTSFVGRQAEIAEIARLLSSEADCHLLTLLGPGGMGKTRLALQAAAQCAAFFANGVCFVSLVGVDAPELLAATLASTLELPPGAGHDPQQQLFDYLRAKQLLLVLDNFEQLVAGGEFLVELLDAASGVKLLLTSRQRLDVREEWLFVVPGLALPAQDGKEAVETYSAVQLFCERAQRVTRLFLLAAEEPAVVRICQLLGGMPLGLELAAAWTRSLSCAEIVEEIQRNLDFLSTTLRNVPERQRSLRAIFEQSWQMLAPAEQQVFLALSLFRGGFERQAAITVAEATLPLLLALVDKSFLQRNPAGRYEMHEGLRQFAGEKLGQATAIQRRHAYYYAELLERRYGDLVNGEPEAIGAVGQEIDNIRAGWEWATMQAEGAVLGQALNSLASYYELRSWFGEGERMFGQAASALSVRAVQTEDDQLVLAQLHERRGWFHYLLGETESAYTRIEHNLVTFRRLENDLEAAYALAHWGMVQSILGENTLAEEQIQASVALFQALGNVRGQAIAWQYLGLVVSRQGRDEEAIPHLQASVTLLKTLNNRRDQAKALKELGNIYNGLENYGRARRLYQESRAMFQALGDLAGAASCLVNLGWVALRTKKYEDAERFDSEGLALFTRFGEQRGMATALSHLGEIARLRGDLPQARQHLERALALNRAIGYRQGIAVCLHDLGRVAGALNDSRARRYFGEALQLAGDLAFGWLILMFSPGLASYLASEGDKALAVEFLSLAVDQIPGDPAIRTNAQATLAEMVADLPPETAATLAQPGRGRDLSAVMDEVLERLLE